MLTTRDAIVGLLHAANDLARLEIQNALQQPAQRLITVLKNRSEDLERQQREEAQLEAAIAEMLMYEEIDL